MNNISDVEMRDGARDFRVMRRIVIQTVAAFPERVRFAKGLLVWGGFKTVWVPYDNVERVAGKSKWNFVSLVRYAFDGIVAFSTVPLEIISFGGLVLFLASLIFILFIAIRWLLFSDPVAGWPSLVCIIAFFSGILLFSIGVLGTLCLQVIHRDQETPVISHPRGGIMKEAHCEVAEDKQIPFALNRCNASLFLSGTDKRRLAALAVFFIIAISCIPVLLSSIPRIHPHDLVFHLYRIDGIAQGLREGQFPVRMQSTQVFGLGYPVSVFYGDLFLYFPALLRLLGMSVRASYALFIVAVNTFCASVTYITCKRMFRSYSVALLGCALCPLSLSLVDRYVAAGGSWRILGSLLFPSYRLWLIFNL